MDFSVDSDPNLVEINHDSDYPEIDNSIKKFKFSENDYKSSRNVLTVPEQVRVIELVDQKKSYAKIAAVMNCSKTQIANIVSRRNKIESKLETSPINDIKNRKRWRSVEYPVVEESLFRWILQQRAKHGYLTNEALREKAMIFFNMLPEAQKQRNFKASDGWLKRFKERKGLRYASISGEKLSADQNLILPFISRLLEKMEEMGITMNELYNADEGALFWKMLPKKTLILETEKNAPGRKVQKDRITIMPCANATGAHKLPLQIIGRSAKPRCFNNKPPEGVFYYSSANAWQTKALFSDYFFKKFVPEVQNYAKKEGKVAKALLILDNASAHCESDELVTDDKSIQCLFLPPNTTSILQPMDQNVILPTKTDYRKRLLRHLLSAGEDFASDLKKFNLKQAIDMVKRSWDQIQPSDIFLSWRKILGETEIYKTLEPLNNVVPRIEKMSEIQKLLMEVKRKSSPNDAEMICGDEINEWLHGDDMEENIAELTDTEIFQISDQICEEDQIMDDVMEICIEPDVTSIDLIEENKLQKGLKCVEYLLELLGHENKDIEESLINIKDVIVDKIIDE